jgi:OOP family OmpA-OmpF porin
VYDYRVRYGVFAAALGAIAALELPAGADPGLIEGAGFIGVDDFGSKIGLGDALAPEQRPQTAPTFGGRLTYLPLVTGRLALGVEGELAFTPSWTGYGFDGPRMSYFAPVFGYRAALVARLRLPGIEPHVVAGGGGETVTSASPFMATDTDPILYYGIGATFEVMPGWQMRIDGRQGFMSGRDGSTTATYELLLGIGTRFGARRAEPEPVKEHLDVFPAGLERGPVDLDDDGVPDLVDRCPMERGLKENDGCPAPDPDGDGIVGAADKCPNQAEDFDHFQDEDGCPDPDNDGDGIVDAKDACPNDPETKNGFDDEDGCPDTIPDSVVAAFEAANAARFEPGRVRLTDAAKLALDKALVTLRTHPTIHVVVLGHPDLKGAPDTASELAKKRAEVVKWYLVEQGIPADQLDTHVGDPAKPKGAPVELVVAPK